MGMEQMTDAQLTAHYKRLQQQARTKMRDDPESVVEQLRAGGASKDEIAATFQRAGIALPASMTRDASGLLVHSEIPITARTGTPPARTGTTTLPSGTIPPRAINPAPPRLGYRNPPSVDQPLPDAVIDEQILKQNFRRR